jgi:tetratricopeptide (TPR) repeat protein
MRAPLTPIKAFVHDAELLGKAGTGDGAADPRLSQWFSVAQAAERLAALGVRERPEYLDALAEGVLPPRINRPTQIHGDGRVPSDAVGRLAERIRLDAEEMELAGCFELALVTVSAACRLLARGAVADRLLATAHLGRVIRQMGDLDAAAGCYSTVAIDAKEAGDGAVAAYGFAGLGNVAYVRGNRPAQKDNFEQALALAPPGSPVELSAHTGLMIVAILQHHLADALLHGWRAHDLSPPDSDNQFQTIINLARVAQEAGFLEAARSGFEYVIQRGTVSRVRMPAIAGAARVAAAAHASDEVERLADLGRVEIARGATTFDAAKHLLACAESWQTLGHTQARDTCALEAQKLADVFGFHEIRMRVEQLLSTPASGRLSKEQVEPTLKQFDPNPTVRTGIERLVALST